MTTGYPTDATTDAVQANIVAARYDVQRVSLSRVTTFTPGSTQEVTATFTNTTGSPAAGATVSLVPARGVDRRGLGLRRRVGDVRRPGRAGRERERDVQGHLAGGDGRRLPDRQGRVDEPGDRAGRNPRPSPRGCGTSSRSRSTRCASAPPTNSTDQFIELYNASAGADRPLELEPDQHAEPVGPGHVGDDPARDDAGERRASTCSASPVRAWRPPRTRATTAINVRSTTGFEAGQKIDIDGETRTIAKRRDGGRGHDDGVRAGVHGAVAHDSRRLDQPARHERDRLRGRPEDRHRHRRQLRTGHGHRGRQGGHADDPGGGGGRGRDQHQGRRQRQHDRRRHADGGHRRTQGARHGHERRHRRRERHGRRPGRPAPVRPQVGHRRVRRGDGDQLLAGHEVPARERRRGAGAGQRHHARPPAGEEPRVRRARGQRAGHDRGLPGAAGAESVVRRRALRPGPARSR